MYIKRQTFHCEVIAKSVFSTPMHSRYVNYVRIVRTSTVFTAQRGLCLPVAAGVASTAALLALWLITCEQWMNSTGRVP